MNDQFATFGGRGWGRTNAIREWTQGLARMFAWNEARKAAAEHLSREACRYSHAPESKSIEHMLGVYARQRGARPGHLPPRLTAPQARRIRKKRNRLTGGKTA